MTRSRPDDPVIPPVTFDNYVIPETVQARRIPRPGFTVNGAVVTVAAVGTLAFVLGILIAVQFLATDDPQAVAAAHPVAPEESVSRTQATDLLTPAAPESPTFRKEDLQAAVLRGLQPERTVGKLTGEELAQRAREARAIVNRNKLRMLREGVLAGTYSVTAREDNGRKRLVLETVNAEMTRESTAHLLRAAAERGDIDVPAALLTVEGEVDMDTLLFNLIQTSLADDGTPEGAEAAREMSRRAFAVSDARTKEVRGQRVYTVEPGDSLAYISLQFYGQPGAYLRIFEANRDKLSSPDLIKIGQRLIIPG